jgi:hypothetical protein
VLYDATLIREGLTTGVVNYTQNALQVVGMFGVMFYEDWLLTLVVLGAAPVAAWVMRRFGKRTRKAAAPAPAPEPAKQEGLGSFGGFGAAPAPQAAQQAQERQELESNTDYRYLLSCCKPVGHYFVHKQGYIDTLPLKLVQEKRHIDSWHWQFAVADLQSEHCQHRQ